MNGVSGRFSRNRGKRRAAISKIGARRPTVRVIVLSFSLLLFTSAALAANGSAAEGGAGAPVAPGRRFEGGGQIAQVIIEQRVIIRVPMQRSGAHRPGAQPPHPAPPAAPHGRWTEVPGPRCVAIRKIVAASVTSARGVDLLIEGDRRLRARLGRECRTADLYSGFYIRPSKDGALCAGRDRILARSGMDCEITAIRRLVPAK